MYAGFCFGVGGFPVIECRTANSASVLNFLRISLNLTADGVEQAAALLHPSMLSCLLMHSFCFVLHPSIIITCLLHPSIITYLLTQITQNCASLGILDFRDSGIFLKLRIPGFLDGIPNRHKLGFIKLGIPDLRDSHC